MGSAEYYFLSLVSFLLSALAGRTVVSVWQVRTPTASLGRVLMTTSILIGLMDLPLDYLTRLRLWADGQRTYVTEGEYLPRDLWSGLAWARDHLPESAVLAVNSYTLAPGDPRYFYYSAFAERPVFLEGWMYSDRTHAIGYARVDRGELHPFPDRKALNDAAFATGSADAIAAMRNRGVTHLVVNKAKSPVSPAMKAAATPVFENPGVAIFDIRE